MSINKMIEGQMSLFDNEPLKETKKEEVKFSRDFGEHIGGARKELYGSFSSILKGLDEMTDAEREKFIKKDKLWPRPPYEEWRDNEGIDEFTLFAIEKIRLACPSKCTPRYGYDHYEEYKKYVKFIEKIRRIAEAVKTREDLIHLSDKLVEEEIIDAENSKRYRIQVNPDYGWLFDRRNDLINCFYGYDNDVKIRRVMAEMISKQFLVSKENKIPAGYTIRKSEDVNTGVVTFKVYCKYSCIGNNFSTYADALKFAKEHSANKRKSTKTRFTPPQLERITRIGEEVKPGVDIVGEDFIQDFGIRGGEFGNWMNENDARTNLRMAYEAFSDLADVIGIDKNKIALNGHLAIAFGARGKGRALAHYEPLRKVINLTKMKGAGSLAHEYFHAIDNIMKDDSIKNSFMSESFLAPAAMKKVVDVMKYKEQPEEEFKAEKEKRLKARKEAFFAEVNRHLSVMDLNSRQNDELTEILYQATKDETEYPFSHKWGENPWVEKISELKKEVKGHVIHTEDKDRLMWLLWDYRNTLTNNTVGKVKTDFYKNSLLMDQHSSKEDKGYWSSTIEMFARAGACFVTDSLKEMGRRNDYLSGHSDTCKIPNPNGEGFIKAYPEGEERKKINEAIRELLDVLFTLK
jgi:hypothetical protein